MGRKSSFCSEKPHRWYVTKKFKIKFSPEATWIGWFLYTCLPVRHPRGPVLEFDPFKKGVSIERKEKGTVINLWRLEIGIMTRHGKLDFGKQWIDLKYIYMDWSGIAE